MARKIDKERHTIAYWDRVAPYYDRLYQTPWSKYEDRLLIDLLNKRLDLSRVKSVLDLGCGSGLGYKILHTANSNIHYTGVDISANMIAIAKAQYPNQNWIISDAVKFLNDNHNKYDLIIALNSSASYFSDVSCIFDLIGMRSNTNGQFLLSFLNKFSLRRFMKLRFSKHENYRTRGDVYSDLSAVSYPLSRNSIKQTLGACKRLEIQIDNYSIFGGVWESENAILIDKIMRPLFNSLGHFIIVSGSIKGREG